MAINATVDGVTYSGIDTINTGGKVIGLTASFPGAITVDDIANGAVTEAIGSANTIIPYAFYGFQSLSIASFSNAINIGLGCFVSCHNLETIYFPSARTIGDSAFYSCDKLVSLSFPNVLSMGNEVFYRCSLVTDAFFPVVSKIGVSAFQNCWALSNTDFTGLQTAYRSAFRGCSSLSTISLPSLLSLSNNAFQFCEKLLSLYLTGSSVANLEGSYAFGSTPIEGYTASTGGVLGSIYVPASLLTAYQSATNWAFFSERFVGI